MYVFNLRPSPFDARDIVLESVYPSEVVLPKTLDLRSELQPIRDQGNQGTCMAQSVAAMKEWQEKVDVDFNGYMSPQFIYNLRENYGGEGMTPRDAMKILNKIGIVPEKIYPYGKIENLDLENLDPGLLFTASKYKIAAYSRIMTVDATKKALLANGPCCAAFPVFNPYSMEFWKPDATNKTLLGGHAVTIVGWTADSFIIRNSWGSSWGDGGYTYFKFSDWGTQWEIWTALDEDSSQEKLEKISFDRMSFFQKLFNRKLRKK